ncbi:hypothetical protein KTD31_02165 [Burkholderia multivorans]|jgi:hypothetical protein|uniref:hypothetical protein n=1 Tax=Burkholderia multivorans TaxID=87883 RepID=UPI001C211076|nr:hypothetical protein [Burkholderia multivorans]MBU9200210.1 hypothetical protein [Burkholderia multivorans]MDN8078663.1 hypothetical protein [Burkholderia multivorans]
MTSKTTADERITAIADALFDCSHIAGKMPTMTRSDFREVIGSAIAQWAAGLQPTAEIAEHIDSLEGQLSYLIGRVKTVPSPEMASLVTDNIRDRLKRIRTLAGGASS